jgi:hypothetical protein
VSGLPAYAYVLVYSTSHALRIEKLFEKNCLNCRLVPVPRHLSSDCGVCVRIDQKCIIDAQQIIGQAGIETKGIAPE